MDGSYQEIRTLLRKLRSTIENLKRSEDDWEINSWADEQMQMLTTMENTLPNQRAPIPGTVRSSDLPPRRTTTATAATTNNCQNNARNEILERPRKKRKRGAQTDHDDEPIDQRAEHFEEVQARLQDEIDATKRKKQEQVDFRREAQNHQ